MLRVFFVFIIFFPFLVLASTNLNSTELKVKKAPQPGQLEQARQLLKEAIAAQQLGDEQLFFEKLEKAKKLQEVRLGTQTFKAAFITKYDHTEINYFSNNEIRYEVNLETTCYNGSSSEAVELLKLAMKNGLLGSDESWYENPRAKGNSILVDLVDGPNNLRDQESIKLCR